MNTSTTQRPACLRCRHFRNQPSYLEQSFPGLKVMGSGMASVRADDGLCLKRDVYLASYYSCEAFEEAARDS